MSFDVNLRPMDVDASALPLMERLLTGEKEINGFLGYSADGAFEITQVRPGPLTVRTLKLTLET